MVPKWRKYAIYSLPARFRNDHFGSEFVKSFPQFARIQLHFRIVRSMPHIVGARLRRTSGDASKSRRRRGRRRRPGTARRWAHRPGLRRGRLVRVKRVMVVVMMLVLVLVISELQRRRRRRKPDVRRGGRRAVLAGPVAGEDGVDLSLIRVSSHALLATNKIGREAEECNCSEQR